MFSEKIKFINFKIKKNSDKVKKKFHFLINEKKNEIINSLKKNIDIATMEN